MWRWMVTGRCYQVKEVSVWLATGWSGSLRPEARARATAGVPRRLAHSVHYQLAE